MLRYFPQDSSDMECSTHVSNMEVHTFHVSEIPRRSPPFGGTKPFVNNEINYRCFNWFSRRISEALTVLRSESLRMLTVSSHYDFTKFQ